MKMTYIILGLLVAGILIFAFKDKVFSINLNNKLASKQLQEEKSQIKENNYKVLRDIAFSVTPENLNLTLPKDKTVAYGAIMDWDFKGTTVTVVAFQTGDASLYLSSGQIFIGGFAHDNIKNSAIEFVSISQSYLTKATKTSSTLVADKNCIRFYILTNNGIYTHQETVEYITQDTNEWSKLNRFGQNIITQYRQISE
jgi:hypothetical protein